MKILFQHNAVLPVKKYGGTERILFWHMCELAKRGHEVLFIGPPGSDLEPYNIKYIPTNDHDWRHLIPNDIDLIHINGPIHLTFDQPTLFTIHGNGKVGEPFPLNTVFVSKSHAKTHGSEHFVHNGLDLTEYPRIKRQRNSWSDFMFLAKANWSVKNLSQCIRACQAANKTLHVAGGRRFYLSSGVKGHGMVSQVEKRELAKNCDALLFPVRWEEPFGIAIIEAMAYGLPVLGSHYGSLSELINERVGLCCDNYNQLVESVKASGNVFDSEEIRQYVEDHFAIKNVTDNYLSYYKRILDGETLHKEFPTRISLTSPETLLDF